MSPQAHLLCIPDVLHSIETDAGDAECSMNMSANNQLGLHPPYLAQQVPIAFELELRGWSLFAITITIQCWGTVDHKIIGILGYRLSPRWGPYRSEASSPAPSCQSSTFMSRTRTQPPLHIGLSPVSIPLPAWTSTTEPSGAFAPPSAASHIRKCTIVFVMPLFMLPPLSLYPSASAPLWDLLLPT